MNVVFSLAFCIVVSFLFAKFFRKLRISAVMGMILAGLIIGSGFKDLFLEPNVGLILALGDAGLLAVMFIAGMEVSWCMLYKEREDAALLAFFAAVTPFLFGFFAFMVMGFGLEVSLFFGICLSITAEATKAKVLLDSRKLKTRIGSLMMGTGIIDDLFGITLFVLVGYLFSAGIAVKEIMMLAGLILSFFLGVFVHREIGRREMNIPVLENVLMFLLSPFFFVSMGISFSAHSIILDPILISVIIVLAFSGKMLGTVLTKPFVKIRMKQLYLVGWGMNSRGAVELALAFIAFRAGFLPLSVYSGLIIMAVITTLSFPFFFSRMLGKDPKIMD